MDRPIVKSFKHCASVKTKPQSIFYNHEIWSCGLIAHLSFSALGPLIGLPAHSLSDIANEMKCLIRKSKGLKCISDRIQVLYSRQVISSW